jgi:hypothetical protein
LGWKTIYEKITQPFSSYDSYFTAPWAFQIDGGIIATELTNYMNVDHTKVVENVDIFNVKNRNVLHDYIRQYGFERHLSKTNASGMKRVSCNDFNGKKTKKREQEALPEPVGNAMKKMNRSSHGCASYAKDSDEYNAMECIDSNVPFSTTWMYLQNIGWTSAFEKNIHAVSGLSAYYVASWAHDIEGSIIPTKKSKVYIIDRTKLTENVDFFNDENKNVLFDYLRKHKFSRVLPDDESKSTFEEKVVSTVALRTPRIKEQQFASDTLVTRASISRAPTASKSGHVKHLGVKYSVDSDEFEVLQCLKEEPIYYPKIFRFLENLGWTRSYVRVKGGYFDCYEVAPWTRSKKE